MLVLALSKNERLFHFLLIISFLLLSKEAQPAVNSISLAIL